jgi:hypothetical protein
VQVVAVFGGFEDDFRDADRHKLRQQDPELGQQLETHDTGVD